MGSIRCVVLYRRTTSFVPRYHPAYYPTETISFYGIKTLSVAYLVFQNKSCIHTKSFYVEPFHREETQTNFRTNKICVM